MSITALGFVLIPLSCYWTVFRPRFLFLALVFFTPFSASAVVNFESLPFGLQPFHYLGLLFILRKLYDISHIQKISLVRAQLGLVALLVCFFMAATFSLLPVLYRGELATFHAAQLAYLLFGVIVTLGVVVEVNQNPNLWQVVNTYVASGLFVSLWGVFQWVCFHMGISYPDMIFNSSMSKATNGYLQWIQDANTTRISSVTTEPSLFARYQLTVLALMIALPQARTGQGQMSQYGSLVLVIGMVVLSTSTVGYVGLFVILLLALVRHSKRILILSPGLVGGLITSFFISSSLRKAVLLMTLNKAESYSFQERLESVITAYELFLKSPLLGQGWSTVLSYDLVVKLLSNVGVVGLTIYLLFAVTALGFAARWGSRLRSLIRVSGEVPEGDLRLVRRDASLVEGLQLAVAITVVVDGVAGFTYVFGHVWILWGLLIGSLYVCRPHLYTRGKMMCA